MSTSVIVISDDIDKSEAIGDFLAQSMENGGFTNIQCTYPRIVPDFEGTGTAPRSLLASISNTYPNFLNEKVTVRAIKVEGMDVNGFTDEDDDARFKSGEYADRKRAGSQWHTNISLFENRPSKKSLAENRAEAATERRATMHAIVDNEKVTE